MNTPVAHIIIFAIRLLFGSSSNCNILLHYVILQVKSKQNFSVNVSIHLQDVLTLLQTVL
jgi:hypothetical protein